MVTPVQQLQKRRKEKLFFRYANLASDYSDVNSIAISVREKNFNFFSDIYFS